MPPEIFMLEPWWQNFFYNMATVQFDHRLLAWVLAVLIPLLWWKLRTARRIPRGREPAPTCCWRSRRCRSRSASRRCCCVVPVPLAALHQAGAVLLFAAALNVAHAMR